MLHELRIRHIHTIDGNVVIDQNHFDQSTIDHSAIDGKVHRVYNAYPESFVVNFRATKFLLLPDSHKLSIVADPPSHSLRIENQVQLVEGKCRSHHRQLKFSTRKGSQGSTIVNVSGNFARQCGERSRTLVVQSADDYLFGVIRSLWTSQGGKITGKIATGGVNKDARLLYEHASRPMLDVLRGINKYSNNLMARALLLTIAAQSHGIPATVESGQLAIQSWLNSRALSMPKLKVINGAGLARDARLSAAGLGSLLLDLYQHPLREELMASLSLIGIDGSTKSRQQSEDLKGRFRLKTGLLRDVRGAAGFGVTSTGRRVVIVILQNHRNTTYYNGNSIQNSVLNWVFRQH